MTLSSTLLIANIIKSIIAFSLIIYLNLFHSHFSFF